MAIQVSRQASSWDPYRSDALGSHQRWGRPSSPTRVLVVDDEPHILDFLSAMLEDEGFDVDRAESASEGLRKARSMHPDLVISDVMMPGATGIDLYNWLQHMEPTPRVVFMSAVTRRSPTPSVPWLEKPFDIDEMLDLVARVIARPS